MRAGNCFAQKPAKSSFFQLIFWFLNLLRGGHNTARESETVKPPGGRLDLYENPNRFTDLVASFFSALGRLHGLEPHWQVSGSAVSPLSRAHPRRLDSTGTWHTRLHIPRWTHVVREIVPNASRDYHWADQAESRRRWYGESHSLFSLIAGSRKHRRGD